MLWADPKSETGRISAAETDRSHLEQQIELHRCDVTHKLDKTGRPYSLAFTKTTGSFERRRKQYEVDQALLKTVNDLLTPSLPAGKRKPIPSVRKKR